MVGLCVCGWDDGDVSGGIMGGDRQKKDDGDGV